MQCFSRLKNLNN